MRFFISPSACSDTRLDFSASSYAQNSLHVKRLGSPWAFSVTLLCTFAFCAGRLCCAAMCMARCTPAPANVFLGLRIPGAGLVLSIR